MKSSLQSNGQKPERVGGKTKAWCVECQVYLCNTDRTYESKTGEIITTKCSTEWHIRAHLPVSRVKFDTLYPNYSSSEIIDLTPNRPATEPRRVPAKSRATSESRRNSLPATVGVNVKRLTPVAAKPGKKPKMIKVKPFVGRSYWESEPR